MQPLGVGNSNGSQIEEGSSPWLVLDFSQPWTVVIVALVLVLLFLLVFSTLYFYCAYTHLVFADNAHYRRQAFYSKYGSIGPKRPVGPVKSRRLFGPIVGFPTDDSPLLPRSTKLCLGKPDKVRSLRDSLRKNRNEGKKTRKLEPSPRRLTAALEVPESLSTSSDSNSAYLTARDCISSPPFADQPILNGNIATPKKRRNPAHQLIA